LVFSIDSDLEEQPEWLFSFAKKMKEDQSDVVYGVQSKRKGGILEVYTGWLFYRLFRLLMVLISPTTL
jgi:putative glycosyltransferase